MKRKQLKRWSPAFLLISFAISLFAISCSDDDKKSGALTLSKTRTTVTIGEEFSVDITLDQPDMFKTIRVEKTRDGKVIPEYEKTLNVSELTFPYTFSELARAEDEEGLIMYSFYGLDADNNKVDASDIVLRINIAQLPLLFKYDWKMEKQLIQNDDWSTPEMKDDVYRFNRDNSWQLDWGTKLGPFDALYSYCAWKAVVNNDVVDSLYMIKYSIFVPTQPIVTAYKVLKMESDEVHLETHMDLSFFGFSDNERVEEQYGKVYKTPSFTPYRGSNPADYVIADCNPGFY